MPTAFTNALADAHRTVAFHRWFSAAMLTILLLTVIAWRSQQTEFLVHIPPDLSNGADVRVGAAAEVQPAYAYLFGFHILQQLNRWPENGGQDFGERIYALQHYLTPACRTQLAEDMNVKAQRGELARRTRALQEIPGYGYAANRVIPHGAGSWTVLVDAQLTETTNGVPVKDTYIRYPLHVVRYDVDRELNPWQLALNCYGGREPERLAMEALQAPAVPRTGAPVSALPAATAQENHR